MLFVNLFSLFSLRLSISEFIIRYVCVCLWKKRCLRWSFAYLMAKQYLELVSVLVIIIIV